MKKKWLDRRMAAVLAALALLVGGLFPTMAETTETSYATVTLESVSAVEILVDQSGSVLDILPVNEEGELIVPAATNGTALGGAFDALIGEMIRRGHISGYLLLSVEAADEAQATGLLEELIVQAEEMKAQYKDALRTVYARVALRSAEVESLAQQSGASLAKADLAREVAGRSARDAGELAALPAAQLIWAALDAGLESYSAASAALVGYIGEETALENALALAGSDAQGALVAKNVLERENGIPVYDIEFVADGYAYEIHIDAASGEALKFEKEARSNAGGNAQQSLIGTEEAKQIALDRAGLTAGEISNFKLQMDSENGRATYEMKFRSGYTEYECEIDAATGELLKAAKEVDEDAKRAAQNKTQSNSNGKTSSSSSDYIGESAAKKIALKHAGVSSSDAKGMRCELDRDDGRVVYEIEFRAGKYEYEYEIDAVTGSVRKADKDRDD